MERFLKKLEEKFNVRWYHDDQNQAEEIIDKIVIYSAGSYKLIDLAKSSKVIKKVVLISPAGIQLNNPAMHNLKFLKEIMSLDCRMALKVIGQLLAEFFQSPKNFRSSLRQILTTKVVEAVKAMKDKGTEFFFVSGESEGLFDSEFCAREIGVKPIRPAGNHFGIITNPDDYAKVVESIL
ncbi:MAG: hypothetical protein Q8O59_02885 [bacterium]|nr:hypothetical protein [bacterium]